jgi:AraC-like DNA-binding protein
MAAVARFSPYHFARQFKTATGLPPHRYVIARRVERAKHLLQAGTELSLAQVAARAGFSDQGQFSRHLQRHVGVTPEGVPGTRKNRLTGRKSRQETAKHIPIPFLTSSVGRRGRPPMAMAARVAAQRLAWHGRFPRR